jgi:hypothetical protein
VGITEMLGELKTHLEHGAELAASHIEPIVEWAAKAEGDPLVQAALGLVVPEGTRAMLASLLKSVEEDVQKVAADAQAKAEAAAAAPPADPAADPAAEAPAEGAAAPDVVSADS